MALRHAVDRYRHSQMVLPNNGNDGAGIEYAICDHAERDGDIPGYGAEPLAKSFDLADYQRRLAASKLDLESPNPALSAVVEQPARDELGRFIVEREPLHSQFRGINLLLQLWDVAIEAAEIARVDYVQPNRQRGWRRLLWDRIDASLGDETVLKEDVVGSAITFIADSDISGRLADMIPKTPKNCPAKQFDAARIIKVECIMHMPISRP
jgi:hypothetical protein